MMPDLIGAPACLFYRYEMLHLPEHFEWLSRSQTLTKFVSTFRFVMERLTSNPLEQLSEFELRHLCYHLEAAGKLEALHRLLSLPTDNGQNAWFEVKDKIGDIDDYLADVTLAWRSAESDAKCSIGLQARYALITASVQTRVRNIQSPLAIALVKHGIWTASKGLTYAIEIPDFAERGRALAALMPFLPPSLQRQAFDTIQGAPVQIASQREEQVNALIQMAPHLSEVQLLRVLETLQLLYETERIRALVRLTPLLPEPMVEDVFEVAHQRFINHPGRLEMKQFFARLHTTPRAERASLGREHERLRTRLPEALCRQLTDHILGTLDYDFINDHARLELIQGVVRYLPANALWQALSVAELIGYSFSRAKAIAAIAWRLPEPLLRKALEVVDHMEVSLARNAAYTALLPRLAELGHMEEALALASRLEDHKCREDAIAGIVPLMARDGSSSRALATIETFKWSPALAGAIGHMAPVLSASYLPRAAELARKIWTVRERLNALVALALRLRMPDILEALNEALGALELGKLRVEIGDRDVATGVYALSIVLAELAPRLAELGFADRILTIVTENCDRYVDHKVFQEVQLAWGRAIAGIGSFVSKAECLRALEIIYRLKTDEARATALGGIAPVLPSTAISSAFERAESGSEITTLAPFLSREALSHAVTDLSVRFENDERVRPLFVAGLAPHLSAEMLRSAMEAAWRINDDYAAAPALCCIASHLQRLARVNGLREALNAFRRIPAKNEGGRAEALVRMAPYLDSAGLCTTIEEAKALSYDWHRSRALSALLPILAQQVSAEEAVRIALSMDDDEKPKMLMALTPYLNRELHKQVLTVAADLGSEYDKAELLAALAPRIPLGLHERALSSVQQIQSQSLQTVVLVKLIPYLPCSLLGRALQLGRAVPLEYFRAQVLACFIPRMCDEERVAIVEEAFAAATFELSEHANEHELEDAQSERDQAQALILLTPHLTGRLLDHSMSRIAALRNSEHQARVFSAIARHLPERQLRQALRMTERLDRSSRSIVRVGLLPRLAELGFPEEALSLVPIVESFSDLEALVAMAPHLPQNQLKATLERIIGYRDAYGNRDRALRQLASMIPLPLLGRLLNASLAIENKFDRFETLQEVISRLATLPTDEFRQIVGQSLRRSAARTRPELLFDLHALTNGIAAHEGSSVISEIALDIMSVRRWWP